MLSRLIIQPKNAPQFFRKAAMSLSLPSTSVAVRSFSKPALRRKSSPFSLSRAEERDLFPFADFFGKNSPFLLDDFPRFDRFEKFFNDPELARLMHTDIYEANNAYNLEVEVPGLQKKDIEITSEEGMITIHTKKQEVSELPKTEEGNGGKEATTKKEYHRSERRNVESARSFRLPSDANMEQMKAKLEHGVLHIIIPKTVSKTKKTIEIEG